MQFKVESENSAERNCTSSIYISQPQQNVVSDTSKPVLTIQVNQNSNENENNGNNNLVNIVSCFRAYPTINGIENVVHNSGSSVANVSVNRNYCNDESVNNENNQNIVNVIKCEDLNEISVDTTISANANSTVDYQNMALDSNASRDRVGLMQTTKIENSSQENVINQIESTSLKDTQQREQRRRERRERRQARQRAAQHGQHRHHQIAVHQRAVNNRGRGNGAEQPSSRASYEMLPDIINNHLPPPYTTLPLHQLPPPHPAVAMHSPPIIAAPVPVVVDDCRFSFPIPIIRRSPSEHSGRKDCCGQFFHSPKSLGLIAMIALGGVACALGGAAWGASGLAGQPSTHLTMSLLMIGIGVVLVTISGVAWKITTADGAACFGMEGTEFDHCGRQPCIRNNSMSHGLLYPEFQHRQPPPTYQASMQEYRLRLLLLDRDRQSHNRQRLPPPNIPATNSSTSPPPTYRSNIGVHMRSQRNSVITNGGRNIFGNNSNGVLQGVPTISNNNQLPSSHETTSSQNNHNSPIIQLTSSTSTTQISQQLDRCGESSGGNKSRQILINHSNDANVGVVSEINLHEQQVKVSHHEPSNEIRFESKSATPAAGQCRKVSTGDESGLVTIVMINNSNASMSCNTIV